MSSGNLQTENRPNIPDSIRKLLGSVRAAVRRYVVMETGALLAIWLVVTFWLALAIDYLPVSSGLDELARFPRILILALILTASVWIVWHFLLRRIFVRLNDSSMSLLLERTYTEFNESLITTVESSRSSTSNGDDRPPFDAAMLERTSRRAQSVARQVDPKQVVNWIPLQKRLVVAALLVGTVVIFALVRPDVFTLASERIYGLGAEKWPRQNKLEMVGLKVQRENSIDGIAETGEVILPRSGNRFAVARGSSITLMIRAAAGNADDTNSPSGSQSNFNSQSSQLPDGCTLFYRDIDGNSGQQTMKRVGVPRDGYQLYSIDGAPLDGMLNDLSFTVRGGDHRIGPFEIDIVDWPAVVSTQLDITYPDYMVDQQSMRWTPRTRTWTGRAQLPEGTKVTVRSTTNKPIQKVYVVSNGGDESAGETRVKEISANGTEFEFRFPPLQSTARYQFYLCDTEGIVSEQPHTMEIEPIEDQPPSVRTALTGIGTAVTPDVEIPVSGSISDDYGIAGQWLKIETPVTDVIVESFSTVAGNVAQSIDFRRLRQLEDGGFTLPTDLDSQITISVIAEDGFNLADENGDVSGPNTGIGDEFVLDVVSHGELLRILERVEVGQRRRLEQVYNELVDARNYLTRSRSQLENTTTIVEPGDRSANPEAESELENADTTENVYDEAEIRDDELRLLFSQRAIMQIDKSTQEIAGVADAFDNIRLQLINNRVDSEDRKLRLQEKIVAPLELIAQHSMGQLSQETILLEQKLKQLQSLPGDAQVSAESDQQAGVAIAGATQVLSELDAVLAILVNYETQNELLDIVRQMIRQQEELAERTTKERKRKAFDGLLDE